MVVSTGQNEKTQAISIDANVRAMLMRTTLLLTCPSSSVAHKDWKIRRKLTPPTSIGVTNALNRNASTVWISKKYVTSVKRNPTECAARSKAMVRSAATL